MEKNVEKTNTALLVMDFQRGIVNHLPNPTPAISSVAKAVNAAHQAGVMVIFVTLGFREGHPEIPAGQYRFDTVKANNMFINSDEATAIHPDITRLPNDIMLVKKRVSAFAGSDLEIILRANKITSLVLSGLSTSGVVLSTVREASDKDYHLTVLSDACADPVPEVHELLVKHIFPSSGRIATTDEWIKEIA
jgi:nicotinamidase-related amidase